MSDVFLIDDELAIVDYDDLDEAILTLLRSITRPDMPNVAIGDAVVPSDTPATPYGILTPNGGPSPKGDLGSQDANRDFRYKILCLGADRRQVRWLERRVHALFMSISQTNYYGAQWAILESAGGIVSHGDQLLGSTSNYLVRM